jgi:hypothetical protein
MEWPAKEGDSPVRGIRVRPRLFQSSTELVELRVKPGRPLSKAKYSLATNSEPVWRLKGEKYPF